MADKRKTAVMSVLLAVAVFLGLHVVIGGSSPEEAAAAGAVSTPPATENVPPSADYEVAAVEGELNAYLEQFDGTVSRDLFTIDYGTYPPADVEPTQPRMAGPADGAAAALEHARREKHVRALAEKLNLQSTMPGDRPTAIINGEVVHEGQQFMGFVVREIKFGSCIVAQGTIEVTLTME